MKVNIVMHLLRGSGFTIMVAGILAFTRWVKYKLSSIGRPPKGVKT